MGLFDVGQSLQSTIGAVSSTYGAVGNAINVGSNLANSIGNAGDPGSMIRMALSGLPAAGEAIGDVLSAVSLFSDEGNSNDWRVRLSLPNWSSFKSSPVLAPLKSAGGFIFPYTPEVTITGGAKYTQIQTTHSNYPFSAYENSNPGTIQITAPMMAEDSNQALYWIAALHYCRSVTKMFTGYDPKAGNPPPIVFLNGYGNYVFKNVPVAITQFNLTLPKDVDYISCDVVGSAAGAVNGIADSIGGLAGTLGGAIPQLSGITSAVSSIAGGVGQVAGLLGTFGLGGSTSGGKAYVPVKSSFTITLQPMYSRTSVRNFSLDRFVTGGYMTNSFGYI
jgi:hypothetical protein